MSALTDLLAWFAEWSIVIAVLAFMLIAYLVLWGMYLMMRAWGYRR